MKLGNADGESTLVAKAFPAGLLPKVHTADVGA